MKYIVIAALFFIGCTNNTREAKEVKCCASYPHPNFDCRTAWMEGKIFKGDSTSGTITISNADTVKL